MQVKGHDLGRAINGTLKKRALAPEAALSVRQYIHHNPVRSSGPRTLPLSSAHANLEDLRG